MKETHWNDSGVAPEPKTKEQIQAEITRLEQTYNPGVSGPGIVDEETEDHKAISKRIAELKAKLEKM
jgi:50S ribosomal subunit-associated GTPase HflX